MFDQLLPKLAPFIYPFRQPFSIKGCQIENCSQPNGVRGYKGALAESVFEATLRRTTLQNRFYNCFSIFEPFGTSCCSWFCIMFLDLGTIWVILLHRFHDPQTKQPPKPKAWRSARERFRRAPCGEARRARRSAKLPAILCQVLDFQALKL